jgi:hypothetical protein
MKSQTAAFLLAVVSVCALGAAGAWYGASRDLRESQAHVLASTLAPMAALLKENQALIKELRAEPFTEKDAGILASYLAKIRRDGVAKHADMKQHLDQLAENNTAIVTLIKAYAPQARTTAFTAEADKFRNYASAWRDRWNSIMELFMAGGTYPATEVPFPKGFPDAVQAELAAAR